MCYEQLRTQVLAGSPRSPRSWGWSLLVRRGMAAYLEAFQAPARDLQAPGLKATANLRRAWPDQGSEMARILATMVWSHFQER